MKKSLVKRNRCAIIAICTVAIVGPFTSTYDQAKAQMGPKETEGLIGGAIFGGIVGSLIGRGGGNFVGGIAGAAIGGFIGSRIGASLDEQDRLALARATRSAFYSGRSQHFSSRRTGVRGSVNVESSNTNSDGKLCRTVVQQVTLKDGNIVRDSVSACRGARGWEI